MIVSLQYMDELQKNSSRPISSSNINNYYKNIGLHFELNINKELMKLKEFALYWKVPITIQLPIMWSLGGGFIKDKSISVTKEERHKFLIDHVLVTPYAVIVLEANSYLKRSYQISGDDWNYMNAEGVYKALPNPQTRMRLYVALMQQILDYYNVNLPVVGKVVLMNDLDLGFLNGPGDDFTGLSNLLYCIKGISEEAPRNRIHALKLIKSFYFDGFWPASYDGNVLAWSE